MMFGASRERTRRVFVETWRKSGRGEKLEPLEQAVAAVIAAHPQYHEILAADDAIERDFPAWGRDANPFLHMGMHLAIMEQVSTDRPAGIRALVASLRHRYPDPHALEHALMDCLAQALGEARASGAMPDEGRYLDCLHRLAQGRML